MSVDDTNRPMSVSEISHEAGDFKFTTALTLQQWLRTAKTLNREARTYLQDGNFPKAYMLYFRQSELITKYLAKHPEAKTPEGKVLLRQAMKGLNDVFENLEKIRPIIAREHEEWAADEAKRKELRSKLKTDKASKTASRTQTQYEKHAARDPTLSSRAKVLDAGDHLDLAVDLAKKEFSRRDADRKASQHVGVSAEEEQSRRTAGFWNNWSDELARKQEEDEEMFRRKMELNRAQDGAEDRHIHEFVQKMSRADRERDGISTQQPSSSTTTSYSYPSISRSTPVQYDHSLPNPDREPVLQPPRPPKHFIPGHYEEAAPRLPELPPKELFWPTATPEASQNAPVRPPKDVEVDPEPPKKKVNREHLTFKPAAYLENGEPIRCVIFPAKMREDFLRLAADNTRRGLEMCGVLCGTAVNNALFVRCLVVPEQKCTSDTCETENEGALFDYCDKEDLIQLGWIHTHPTQTCFMSSRDLHTQAGYQIMLPESIAIVCAPTDNPSYGIFRLTNPPGLPHVLQCTQTTTFHPHSVDNLYTTAGKKAGGHVFETDNLEYNICDLRPDKGY
ncbi:endosome-associated ubiquitin isopeptidase [Seiridium cupressi]